MKYYFIFTVLLMSSCNSTIQKNECSLITHYDSLPTHYFVTDTEYLKILNNEIDSFKLVMPYYEIYSKSYHRPKLTCIISDNYKYAWLINDSSQSSCPSCLIQNVENIFYYKINEEYNFISIPPDVRKVRAYFDSSFFDIGLTINIEDNYIDSTGSLHIERKNIIPTKFKYIILHDYLFDKDIMINYCDTLIYSTGSLRYYQ